MSYVLEQQKARERREKKQEDEARALAAMAEWETVAEDESSSSEASAAGTDEGTGEQTLTDRNTSMDFCQFVSNGHVAWVNECQDIVAICGSAGAPPTVLVDVHVGEVGPTSLNLTASNVLVHLSPSLSRTLTTIFVRHSTNFRLAWHGVGQLRISNSTHVRLALDQRLPSHAQPASGSVVLESSTIVVSSSLPRGTVVDFSVASEQALAALVTVDDEAVAT